MIWLEIDSQPPTAFYREAGADLLIDDIALVSPALVAVGTLQRPLSIPGLSAGENASVTVDLDNAAGAITRLFAAAPPVRMRARVMDEAGELFAGVVTDVDLSSTAKLTIEAGLARPLSDTVPLRNTTAWGEYQNVRTLPIPYGSVTLTPVQYDATGLRWLVADCPIGGVDAVTVDGQPTLGWTWRNTVDPVGHPCAVLTLINPVQSADAIAVRLRGKLHPTLGHVLTRPDEILLDLLANVCGMDLTASDLDEFRVACTGLAIGGLLDDASRTIRAQVDLILQSVGAAWSAAAPGIAYRYPFAASTEGITEAAYTVLTAAGVTPTTSHTGLANVVRVRYDYDWSTGEHAQVIQVEDAESIRQYGRIELEWDAGWLHDKRLAVALGDTLLAWLAWPRWRVEWTAQETHLRPGDWITLDHQASPISGRHRLISVATTPGRLTSTLAIEAAAQAETITYPTYERITEAGGTRITEGGDARILE